MVTNRQIMQHRRKVKFDIIKCRHTCFGVGQPGCAVALWRFRFRCVAIELGFTSLQMLAKLGNNCKATGPVGCFLGPMNVVKVGRLFADRQ
jgi:hypothetical protein